ncbi:MAG TPA: ATP-binding protein [Chthonomonadaceae bacterium]|nr:ATP-binding protein [Chthonomonadaceae bacterium]
MDMRSTDDHDVDDELYASRTMLREIIDNIPQRVFWKNRDCVFLGCNQAFATDMGFADPDALMGKTDFDVSSNANGHLYRADDMAVMESGNPKTDYEEQQLRADGRTVWLKTCKVPLRDKRGVVVGVLGTYEDITERKRAQEERDRFFTLSLDMLAIASADGSFTRLNPAFESTLGISASEILSGSLLDLVHRDDRAATERELAKLDGGVRALEFVNRCRCRDGGYKWLSWRAVPHEGLLYMVAHDVTPLKDADAALRCANEELEQRVADRTAELVRANAELTAAKERADTASQAKSEFLSRMSHELRTPMNAILGFGQILDRPGLTALQQECVHYILRGGRHLLDLINEVLDIARVEAGRMELSVEPIPLAELVTEACALVRPLASDRGIRICEEGFATCSAHVLADRQRLKQVFLNLLSNAIKYNVAAGRVDVLCTEQEDGTIRIAVRDTGPGITEAELPKLFSPFERLSAATSDVEGTGLGLVLSQRLITAMGGTLKVDSVVGVGTTFYVELPRAASPQDAYADQKSGGMPAAALDAAVRDLTILCVEDNLSNLRLMEVLLQGGPGVTLLAAMQGSVGIDLACLHRPDVILLDLNLPDISGKEVLGRLRTNPATAQIPVIVISADATPNQVERLIAAGAQAYLTKPLDISDFVRVLNEVLQAANPERGLRLPKALAA